MSIAPDAASFPMVAPRTVDRPRCRPSAARRSAWGLLVLLAGCSTEPGRETSTEAPARAALVARSGEGPILTSVHGNPFDMDDARRNALVTTAMAAGVAGLSPRFTVHRETAAAPEPHLVVILNPLGPAPEEVICSRPETVATEPASGRLSVLAAFCAGAQPLGSALTDGPVSGPTDRRFERLLWRTSAELFPDDYWESYGFGILPQSMDFGIGGSFGTE